MRFQAFPSGFEVSGFWFRVYIGTSLARIRALLGPCRRPVPRVLGGALGGGRFLMGEVPLYAMTGRTHLLLSTNTSLHTVERKRERERERERESE